MNPLRVVTVAGNIDRETALAEALGRRSDVELVLRCLDRVELLAAIRGANLAAIVVVGDVEWFDRQSVSEAATHHIAVVQLTDHPRSAYADSAIRMDASIEELVAACAEPTKLVKPPSAPAEQRGRITAVWGPKGAPGRTRLAIELAHVLEATGSHTLLIDGDPYGGDVLQCLNVVDELPSLIWATRMAAKGELDENRLEKSLRRVPDGPVVLPGLPRADLWPDVGEFGFGELLEVCRASFKHTVADTGFCLEPSSSLHPEAGEGRNRIARRLLRDSERVVAVCGGSPLGMKNFLWAFEELRSIVDPDRVVVAINRTRRGTERELAQLLDKHIGKRPVSYVPDLPLVMDAALEQGMAASTLRGGAEVRAAIEALGISVGARLRPRGVLTKLAARR